MVDLIDSKSVVERRASSSLARGTILATPKYLIIKSRFLKTVRLGMRTSHPSLINFSYIGILNLYEGKISSPRKIHFT